MAVIWDCGYGCKWLIMRDENKCEWAAVIGTNGHIDAFVRSRACEANTMGDYGKLFHDKTTATYVSTII